MNLTINDYVDTNVSNVMMDLIQNNQQKINFMRRSDYLNNQRAYENQKLKLISLNS